MRIKTYTAAIHSTAIMLATQQLLPEIALSNSPARSLERRAADLDYANSEPYCRDSPLLAVRSITLNGC